MGLEKGLGMGPRIGLGMELVRGAGDGLEIALLTRLGMRLGTRHL